MCCSEMTKCMHTVSVFENLKIFLGPFLVYYLNFVKLMLNGVHIFDR